MVLQLDWKMKALKLENIQGIVREFGPGEYLLKDKSGKMVGLLTEGVAKNTLISEEGKERVVSFLTPLAIFGEVTIFSGRQFISNLSVQSVTPVKVVYITKEELENMVRQDPDMAFFLLHASCEKVSSLISLINGSSFQNTLKLLVDVLSGLGSRDGEVCMSHEEIAGIIGRNRVTVSRTLLKLQKAGAIEQKKRKIVIKDWDMLLHFRSN